MAITIETIPHSFIRLEEPLIVQQCITQPKACLPVLEPEDLVFQFIVQVSGSDKDWFMQEPEEGQLESIWGALCDSECNLIGDPNQWAMTYRADWQRILEDETDVWVGSFYFNNNDLRFDSINTHECFRICFYRVRYDIEVETGAITGLTTEQIACSETCLIKINDDCLTSLFEFRNFENSLGYYYIVNGTDMPSNRIRLSCYPHSMKLPKESAIYQKSTGEIVKRFERVNEEYELRIDYMPKHRHKYMKILLAHDEIGIDNYDEFAGQGLVQIICDADYEIEWIENFRFAFASGNTTIKTKENLYSLNLNCG